MICLNTPCHCGGGSLNCDQNTKSLDRRSFLRKSAVLASGIAALAASLAPLRELTDFGSVEEFLQKHYKELTPDEMEKALARIRKRSGAAIRHPPARARPQADGRRGVCLLPQPHALHRLPQMRPCLRGREQPVAQPGDPIHPRPEDAERHVRHGERRPQLRSESVPEKGFFYMPVQCQQCKNPPCVKVCPVDATWQEADGITVIDYDWCIGCRYCEAACPYFARRFNFAKPSIPKDRINPNMAYLGNRPRQKGVMEKCHFCIQRTRAGKYPACLEVCPTGARKFGNILDPNSEVSYILKNKRVFVLKEEIGTLPRFFYYFDV